jgi:hypothetical protein
MSGRCERPPRRVDVRVGLGSADRDDGLMNVEEINSGPSKMIVPVEAVGVLAGQAT